MAHADTILRAVDSIHAATLASDGWTQVAPHIAAATGSRGSFFLAVDPLRQVADFATGHEVPPEFLAQFAATVAAGRFPAWALRVEVGRVVQGSSMQDDRDFARSVFYNEAIRPWGNFYGVAVVAQRTPHRHVYLTAGRQLGCDDYGTEDVLALQTLMPHVTTALRVNARLADADLRAAAADAALDRLDAGVVLVDAAGAVLYANRPASLLFDRSEGLRLEQGSVGAIDAACAHRLRRLMAACARADAADRGAGGSVDISRGEGRLPLKVLVAPFPEKRDGPFPGWLGAARPAAMLLVSDPERTRAIKIADLRARYELTAAEADAALEIAKGDGRQAAANRLGIGLPTLATHLQHVFSKTGASRQAELVRLVLDSHHDIEV